MPLSVVTKSGKVWRKVPENGARSVQNSQTEAALSEGLHRRQSCPTLYSTVLFIHSSIGE